MLLQESVDPAAVRQQHYLLSYRSKLNFCLALKRKHPVISSLGMYFLLNSKQKKLNQHGCSRSTEMKENRSIKD